MVIKAMFLKTMRDAFQCSPIQASMYATITSPRDNYTTLYPLQSDQNQANTVVWLQQREKAITAHGVPDPCTQLNDFYELIDIHKANYNGTLRTLHTFDIKESHDLISFHP